MLQMMTSDFVTALECLYVKLQSRVLTACEFTCLRHGFVARG